MHITLNAPMPVVTKTTTPRFNWSRIAWRCAVVVMLLDITLAAAIYGLRIRKAAFVDTTGVHFLGDVSSGFKWGTLANDVGLFNLYDQIVVDINDGRRTMDYAPLRLTAVWAWSRWAHEHYPDVGGWQDDYDFTRPMLNGNTVAEFISAVLIFFLIRLWRVRMDDARRTPDHLPRPMFRGVIPGLFGAMLFWFNPAVIRDGYSWPQWDVWLVPFFVAAVLLASLDWWFVAGMAVMVGAAFKGQILLAAPVLVLWPIFSFRFGAVLRLVCGFFFAASLIVLPWMKLDETATSWCWWMGIAVIALLPATLRIKPKWERWFWLGAGVVVLIVVLSQLRWASSPRVKLLPVAVLIPVALARFLPRRLVPHIHAAAIAAVIFLTIPYFNADSAWFTSGFKYGTEKFGDMITGTGTWNIAKMQQVYAIFGYTFNTPDDAVTLPLAGKVVTYRTAALIVYGVCLLIAGAGAAIHSRKRSPNTRFLVAMVAPWICFFMILPQMHGRYLMWAAGLSALLAGVSVGMALLGLLVTAVSWMNIVENQYMFQPGYDPDGLRTLQSLDPHVGWMVLLIMLIYLYVAVTGVWGSRSRKKRDRNPSENNEMAKPAPVLS